MSTLTEIQRAALELSDDERALLMARLWESLADSNIEDNVVEQRLKEFANDPASEISHHEFIAEVQKARSSER
ncbi:MAG TPA: addiction module protein [Verrucomicrobiae bacterium]